MVASIRRGDDEEAVQTARMSKAQEYFAALARRLLDLSEPKDPNLIDDDVEAVLAYLGWNFVFYELGKQSLGYSKYDALQGLDILEAASGVVRTLIQGGSQSAKEGQLEETVIQVK